MYCRLSSRDNKRRKKEKNFYWYLSLPSSCSPPFREGSDYILSNTPSKPGGITHYHLVCELHSALQVIPPNRGDGARVLRTWLRIAHSGFKSPVSEHLFTIPQVVSLGPTCAAPSARRYERPQFFRLEGAWLVVSALGCPRNLIVLPQIP
jgi:hypothetical protein